MGELKTERTLLDRLSAAAHVKLSAEQLRAQKVSFIMGSLSDDSKITRDRVEEELNRLEGNVA